ncbi:DUF7638 domain-containing protein [Rubritalea sp.]|uniref:DUF7638 domain-containing protein n=1 Tax=Rubritalea sp. TaxID=2109375 RepID=UPI003EF4FF96
MWPFKSKSFSESFYYYPIVRTKPDGKHFGYAISGFINNMQCHYTTIDVYSDGVIDCWGFVDRDLFQGKINQNWVVSSARHDQSISIFNLGITNHSNAKWINKSQDIKGLVTELIKDLNPSMKGLVDMQGSDTEVRGHVTYSKMGSSDKKPYRRVKGELLLADSVPVIIKQDGGIFELSQLFIFEDSKFRIGVDSPLISYEELKDLYQSGKLLNKVNAGSRFSLPGIGEFTCDTELGYIDDEDRLREIKDKLGVLNGNKSIVTQTAEQFDICSEEPSSDNLEKLRSLYEQVPTHERMYCGDMDTKDYDIRRVLYGDEDE